MTDDNKRSAPRAAADFVAELYDSDGQTLIGIAKLSNLSVSGACVESTNALDHNAKVVLRLLLGKRHILTLPAEVMWVKELPTVREYGLKFGAYHQSAQNLVAKFVQEYFSNPANPPVF